MGLLHVPDLARIDQMVKAADAAGIVLDHLSDVARNTFTFTTPSGRFEVKCPGHSLIDLLFAEQFLLLREGRDPDEQADHVDQDAAVAADRPGI